MITDKCIFAFDKQFLISYLLGPCVLQLTFIDHNGLHVV